MADELFYGEPLTSIEIAHYLVLLGKPRDAGGAGLTDAAIAQRFARSVSWLQNLKRLTALPEAFQEKLARGEILETAARSLLPFKDCPDVLHQVETEMRAHPDKWAHRADVVRGASKIARELGAPGPKRRDTYRRNGSAARNGNAQEDGQHHVEPHVGTGPHRTATKPTVQDQRELERDADSIRKMLTPFSRATLQRVIRIAEELLNVVSQETPAKTSRSSVAL
jgi:hypothetical protein